MKKEGAIDLRGHLIYHTAWSSSKNIWPRGLFNTIFFLGPQNETALLLQKKWMMTDVRRGWDLRQKLSLCYLSLLQASLTTWIVSRLSNQWFTNQSLPLLAYCTETEYSIRHCGFWIPAYSSYCPLEHKTDTQWHKPQWSTSYLITN